ncbi:hypothetical protein L6164_029842 [Bauhinia variegata]|uniref:Uncharacterized protein n=1 Tax=Bauhinia variegata TaxID=167791 RepID=A0ACB9LAH0_BAUVA|nr:hypothetical protein L6164_029842 [Bauhinia variegata]
MSKLSQRVIQGLLRRHDRIDHYHLPQIRSSQFSSSSSPSCSPLLYDPLRGASSSSTSSSSSIGFSGVTRFTANTQSKLIPHAFSGNPISSNGSGFRFFCSQQHNPILSMVRTSRNYSSSLSPPTSKICHSARRIHQTFCTKSLAFPKQCENYAGFRFISFKSSASSKVNGGLAKKVFEKPATAVSSAFSRYSEAIGLQFEAFFKRNYLFLLGAAGVLVCALLWRIMFGIASTFVGLSEGMAKYGFLALSSAIVAFGGLYIRSRFIINPDKVYRMAMRKLNTSAGILEVMGAPLSGTDLRAYVMSGGGLTLKNFKPRIRSKRCFLIFPIRGSERKGLVSVEVKKKKGQHDMKLLAIDVPMASGPDQRLFVIGDEEGYRIGGGLISELREPVVRAMAATKEFDDLDQIEEEEEAERERQEAERKHREEIEKIEKGDI